MITVSQLRFIKEELKYVLRLFNYSNNLHNTVDVRFSSPLYYYIIDYSGQAGLMSFDFTMVVCSLSLLDCEKERNTFSVTFDNINTLL